MYLSLLFVSRPLLAANARGEGSGNGQVLQYVTTPRGSLSVLSGQSIRRAIRENMLAQGGGANMWRKHDINDGASGYGYGPDNEHAMKDAVPDSPAAYDDTLLFGYMIMAKKKKGQDAVNTKHRSALWVSEALSATPYAGDRSFTRGLTADGSLNPFHTDRHYTQYAFSLTVNLNDMALRPGTLPRFLDACRMLRVGGNQAAHASELVPESLVYRLHAEPASALAPLAAEGVTDAKAMQAAVADLGLSDVHFAGADFDTSIADAWDHVKALGVKQVAALNGN